MILTLAPRLPRGCSRVWLSIVTAATVAGLGYLPASAQQGPAPTTTPPPAKADPAKPPEPAKDDDDDAVDEKSDRVEVYKDPNAAAALANTFPESPYPRPDINLATNPNDLAVVKSMAGGGKVDRELLTRYVDHFVADLTNHRNIAALLTTPPQAKNRGEAERNSRTARMIDQAATALMDPLFTAKAIAPPNSAFLNDYNRVLLAKLPSLLENHYFARVEAMIIIGSTGSPQALDIYTKQLNNRDQILAVKVWAARGLALATQNGKVDLADQQKAIAAGKALAGFLDEEPKTLYVAQIRALESMGMLRQPSSAGSNKGEMALAAMKLLADPEAKLDVRAFAAWSLGMLRLGQLGKVNVNLVAYAAGALALDIGTKVVESVSPKESDQIRVRALASRLIYQVIPAFVGDKELRDSGLVKVAGQYDKAFVDQVQGQIQALAASAVKLTQGSKAQLPGLQKDVTARVADLKKTLDNFNLKDRTLLPGGDEFKVVLPQPDGAGGAVAGGR